ncbi:MAG TPA: four helix bundle protein [Thermoanaerobaculia bacterium]
MNYRKLDVWEKSVQLAVEVFIAVDSLPWRARDLAAQMRRASASVPSNVAESTGRSTPRDQRQFAVRARGSLAELDTQLEICRRLAYLQDPASADLDRRIRSVGEVLSGLIRYYAGREKMIRAKRKG